MYDDFYYRLNSPYHHKEA